MTNIWLMLLLSVIRVQPVCPLSSCPASCAVCSEDVLICQRLAHIIDAPDSTQALLLTEGSISAVPPASLSDLINITVIGLSNNHISELSVEAFTTLPFLHTLLLDHNLLTSQAIQRGALTNLTQLEFLSLGHNFLSMIQASWFVGSRALRSLKLEGNLLTKLDSGSFPPRDLMYLENLDLSDNLINQMDENSFRGLASLKTLDISRNRLRSAPVEAFSYLNWLTNLNLDLNSWNCSCQLLELATFLSTFMQQPDKVLYNGRRMVCVSADNPAVTTVLELTDANCVPSNHNITVQVETKGSITPHVYAQDVAIAAVLCFIGGVSITLLVVLIIYQVFKKKKLKEIQRLKDESEESQIVTDYHLAVGEERRNGFLQANGNPQHQKEALKAGTRMDGYTIRTEEDNSYYRCHNFNVNGMKSNPRRGDNRMNGMMETEGARERRKLWMMMEEEKRRAVALQSGLNRDTANRSGTKGHHENLHCDSCYRTYRPPEQNVREGRLHSNPHESTLLDGFSFQQRPNGKHQFDVTKNADLRRETRKVTFDPKSLRLLEQRSSWDEEQYQKRTATSRDRSRHKSQSGRRLKVKLNLNPQRKSKIHPRKKNEHLDERSTRKDIEKDSNGRDGKERKQYKLEKSAKSEKFKVEGEKNMEKDNDEEEGQKEQKKKTTSKEKQEIIEVSRNTEDNSEGTIQEHSQPSDITHDTNQLAPADIPEQPLNRQDVQYPGTGLTPASSQQFSQPPVTHHTTNVAVDGHSASQFSSSNSSDQAGNTLNLESNANAMLPRGPSVSTINAPNMGLRLDPDNLSIQAAVGPTYDVSSLLASTQPANSLQAGGIHTVVPHSSQTGDSPLNLAANTEVSATTIQSSPPNQLASDSSLLAFRMNPDPGNGSAAFILEQTAAPIITRDTLVVGDEGNPSNMSTSNFESFSMVENMSNNNSQRAINVSAPVTSTQRRSSSGGAMLQQEYLSEEGGSSPRRKLRLVLPEKSSSRPPTALERKIR